jgi:heat shock protein HslJ
MRARPLLVVVALLVASCDDSPFKPSDVTEVTWKLESIERTGIPTIQVPNPEQYTLKLGNDGRLAVRADCNTCSTTYTLDGSTLKVGQLACTLIACPVGSLDGAYAGVITGTNSIALSDSHLVLRNGAVTLRFRN